MTKFFIVLATLSFVILSCNRMQKTPSGVSYKIFTKGSGEKISGGDYVYFKMIAKTGDSVLFNSYRNAHRPYFEMPVKEDFQKGGFEEGFSLLSGGDSAMIRLNADSFYHNFAHTPTPEFIKKGGNIDFFIKIDSLIKKKTIDERRTQAQLEMAERQKKEPAIIEEYIAKSGTKFTKTASGLYYIITKATHGTAAGSGDNVQANYTGKLFDGQEFDSNSKTGQPFEFTLGAQNVIAGWDELFALMHEGEKATAVIPSSLAYGSKAAGELIKPFTPLVFDVELIKVTKAKK